MPRTVYDPTKTSAAITISGGGLVATKTSGVTDASLGYNAISGVCGSATKIYMEVTNTTETALGYNGFGIVNSSFPIADGPWPGDSVNSSGIYYDTLYYNGAVIGIYATPIVAGNVIGIALDTAAHTVAFRNVTLGGAWSIAIPAPMGQDLRFCASIYGNNGSAITANFNGTFVGAVPAGYARWNIVNTTLKATTGYSGDRWNNAAWGVGKWDNARTFRLAGKTVRLFRGYKLTASVRAIVFSGKTAILNEQNRLVAVTRAIVMTPQTAGLRIAKKLVATVGAFVLAPKTARLVKGYNVIGTTRAIVLSGKTVNLNASIKQRLTAQVGAIVLAPKTVGLGVAKKLVATAGAIVLTPRTAILNEANKLVAVTSAIVLTPSTAGLRTTRSLTTQAGAIVVSPKTVALKLARKLTTQPGAIVLTPKTVTIYKTSGATVIAQPGAIILSPKTATLRLALRLSAQAGAIVVTGKTADLIADVGAPSVDYVMQATTGTVIVTGRMAILTAAREVEPPPETIHPGVLNMGRRVIILPNRW